MNDHSLAEIFDEVYKREFAEFKRPRRGFFSLRHRREMRRILYPNSTRKSGRLSVSLKRKILIITVLIFLAVITGAVSAGAVSDKAFSRFNIEGFRGKAYHDKTQLFAINEPAAPQIIDQEYSVDCFSRGFELVFKYGGAGKNFLITEYANPQTGERLYFQQYTKNIYDPEFENDYGTIDPIKINDKNGFIWESRKSDRNSCICWDNGDFILVISGDLDKDLALNLAKTAKI